MNPKSMERLFARFETFRDKEPIGLLYSIWRRDIEPLHPSELPTTYKAFANQQPTFRFSPAKELSGLLIVRGDNPTVKRLVMATYKTSSKELHNELCNCGFEPDAGIVEINWLWALIEAASKGHLGCEGFVDGKAFYQSSVADLTVDEATILDDSLGWSMADFVPRKFMQLENIVESSIRLIEYLRAESEAPRQKTLLKEQNTDNSLRDLYEIDPTFCLKETLEVIAQRLSLQSVDPVLDCPFYKFYLKELRDAYRIQTKVRQQATSSWR
jgi:hypothetical protein